MTTTPSSSTRPQLSSGRAIPIDLLNAAEFEDFVFACLMTVGPTLGFRVTGKPSGTGDGGFDVQAERTTTRETVCIQCKHQKAPLETSQVAEELAKVAANSFFEGAAVVEHRFICTGGVRKKLRKLLREASRQELIASAGQKLADAEKGDLSALRNLLEKAAQDPREIAESYVRNLESIVAWDFHEFDVSLSNHWTEVLQIARRFFQIETVVLEHPRATFNRAGYFEEHRNFRLAIEPRLSPTRLPPGIALTSAADPGRRHEPTVKDVAGISDLATLDEGALALLVGAGGGGKTEALRLIRSMIIQEHPESALPVLFSLAQYTSGALDRMVHQELGIVNGTWRSLPDRIVLLCDGLNECTPKTARDFLDELGPLLKRKRIACIIAMREATSRSNIILPEATYAFVRVEQITPIGIRRLAETTLNPADAARFVKSYRSIADTSGSPLLWTPFAVRVALQQWHANAKLPNSLGAMLEVLLTSRCARNSEQPGEQLEPQVILALSRALAFQRLILDGQLECPATEAGSWLKTARVRCQQALGVADVRDQDLIELLIAHDLLRRAQPGYFAFEHQLTSGALAAPLLASAWRQNVHSLSDQIADDAWVFAASLVPEDDTTAFLDAVLNADLILGARAARDLGSAFRAHAQKMLEPCVRADAPEPLRIRGVFALAALGSDEAKAMLHVMANDQTDGAHYASRVALATTGDGPFLQELLNEIEALSATPFKFSGGDTAVWQAAPLTKRLDAARQRLAACQPGDHVGRSLILISFERDRSDIPLIERHLVAAKDFGAWGKALHALNAIDPGRARTVVQNEASPDTAPTYQAQILRVAFLAGVDIDVDAACRCAMSDKVPFVSNREESYAISQLIQDVIANLPIPEGVVRSIAEELPKATGARREQLWEFAYLCENASLADYAETCIRRWEDEVWAACNYLSRHLDLAKERQASIVSACEAGLSRETNWWSPITSKALELTTKLGISIQLAGFLGLIVERFERVREAIENDGINSLRSEESSVLSKMLPNHQLSELTMMMGTFLPVISLSRKNISCTLLTNLLKFDFYSSSAPQELREALSACDEADIDSVLAEIQEPMTLAKSLAVVCRLGATKTRIELIGRVLEANYAVPAVMKQLCDAIESCWSHEVLKMILDMVSSIPRWTDYEIQFFWDLARLVARQVSKEDEHAIEGAIAVAQTTHAKRLLESWRIEASNERIGLSRLSLPA